MCRCERPRVELDKGPWTLARFFTKKKLPEEFDLDEALADSCIHINMIPNIVKDRKYGSYELVVAISCIEKLLRRFPDFTLIVNHDPFEPAEEEIRKYGICAAEKRARVNVLSNAAEAIRKKWGGEPAVCYRDAVLKVCSKTELENAVLEWDIEVIIHTSL